MEYFINHNYKTSSTLLTETQLLCGIIISIKSMGTRHAKRQILNAIAVNKDYTSFTNYAVSPQNIIYNTNTIFYLETSGHQCKKSDFILCSKD